MIFWITCVKDQGRKKFLNIVLVAVHHKVQPNWPIWWWHLADGFKGQCRNSKKKSFPTFDYQSRQEYIFFKKHLLPLPFMSQTSRCGLCNSHIQNSDYTAKMFLDLYRQRY